ncbi:MAG: hypothetical protein KY475_25445, partial [Planctomycetes bacterium]|nr:hypothetical protein [Planctomycetota bacterium]
VQREARGPAWLQRLAGGKFAQRVVGLELTGRKIGDGDLSQLCRCPYLTSLVVDGATEITDQGMDHVGASEELAELSITGAVTDEGMERLGAAANLQVLRLVSSKITDRGLLHLQHLKELRRLELIAPVTDAGMAHLQPLSKLESLRCARSPVLARVLAQIRDISTLECRGTPLEHVMAFLSETQGVAIRIDEPALNSVGASKDLPITTTLIYQVVFTELLDRILKPRELEWTFDNRGLVITSEAAASEGRAGLTALQEQLPNLKRVEVDW